MISETEAKNLVETTINELPKVEKQAGKVVLKVEGLYKKFCRNLKRSMIYGMSDLAKGFVGIPPKTEELRKDEFWALQDINFELRENEILGIIGANGSGKSTLLRVLTGIFPPDKGSVWIDGKVGGIIALGAGMHPHMTGRENIYLNGTILGMTKQELDSKFNEIVDFAELGEFLEAPLSTYSSGMKVRLGFAVAVHCQPEILLVDEVLAVGDLSFKNKCLRKLSELRKSAKAVIFISHDMEQIKLLCDRVIILNNSKVFLNDYPLKSVVEFEKLMLDGQQFGEGILKSKLNDKFKEESEIKSLVILINDIDSEFVKIKINEAVEFKFILNSEKAFTASLVFGILDLERRPIIWIDSSDVNRFFRIDQGLNKIKLNFDNLNLMPGKYLINYAIRDTQTLELVKKEYLEKFLIINSDNLERISKGYIKTKYEFESL